MHSIDSTEGTTTVEDNAKAAEPPAVELPESAETQPEREAPPRERKPRDEAARAERRAARAEERKQRAEAVSAAPAPAPELEPELEPEPEPGIVATVVAVDSTEGTMTHEAPEAPTEPAPPHAPADAAAPVAASVPEAQRRYGLPARPRLRVSFGWTASGVLTCEGVLMDERRELVAREQLDPLADPVIGQAFSYFASLLVRRLQESGALVVINPSATPQE